MRIAIAIGALALLLVAADQNEQSGTPAEQYKTLLKEYQLASSSGRVLSDEERLKFVGEVFKHRNTLALKFIELAETYPHDPIAVDALIQAVWNVNTTPWPLEILGKDEASSKGFALLMRDHIQDEKLGQVCPRISSGFREEYEPFLRAVLDKNPHQNVQAQACLALAHFLTNRLHRLEMVRSEPALAKEFADLFGKDYLEELLKQDSIAVTHEAEALLELSAKKYGDEKLPNGDSVGKKAEVELFELRFLSIGKEAPDIEGEDQDGKRFKLSDYRGKVVLLDFWSEY